MPPLMPYKATVGPGIARACVRYFRFPQIYRVHMLEICRLPLLGRSFLRLSSATSSSRQWTLVPKHVSGNPAACPVVPRQDSGTL